MLHLITQYNHLNASFPALVDFDLAVMRRCRGGSWGPRRRTWPKTAPRRSSSSIDTPPRGLPQFVRLCLVWMLPLRPAPSFLPRAPDRTTFVGSSPLVLHPDESPLVPLRVYHASASLGRYGVWGSLRTGAPLDRPLWLGEPIFLPGSTQLGAPFVVRQLRVARFHCAVSLHRCLRCL